MEEDVKKIQKNWSIDECFEFFKANVPIEKILTDGKNLILKEESDYISYKEFLSYFSNLKEPISKHNLVIAINFTYGWMPTIFDFRSDKFDEALNVLNIVKQGDIPKQEQLMVLKKLFNNSLVGTSKILHFINPENISIWDSRVFRYLTNCEPNDRIDKYEAFLGYIKFCDYISKQESYNEIHILLEKQINSPMTKFRTIELIMYTFGEKPINKIANEPTS
ncbi:MAG: hypothetical protein RL708_1607 [Bacteroidota bacterium]|jgi:hypothetical protein